MQKSSSGALRLCGFNQRAILTAAVAAAVGGAWATNTYGQTIVTWDGTTGAYTEPTNWNPDVVPSNAANEVLTINNGGTAQVSGVDAAEGAYLYLGVQPGETGHLEVSGGTLNLGEMRVGGLESIPDLVTPTNPPTPNGGGTGSVVQTGGTVNLTYTTGTEPPRQSLWIGDAGLASGNTANGSYTITSGTLLSGIANNDGIFVGTGVGSQATFDQQGGTVTSTGFVTIGRRGAVGTWTISDGTLNQNGLQGLTLGDAANADNTLAPGSLGTFTQSGGDVNVTTAVEIGRRGGTGVYNMSAGTLDVTGQVVVGAVATTSPLLLSANGTFNVSGTAAIGITTNLNVGGAGITSVSNAGVGTLNMTGGSIVLSGLGTTIFAVGNGVGCTGTVNFSGGTITHVAGSAANVDIGRSSATGTMNISGSAVLNAKQITLNSTNVAVNRSLNISGGTVDTDLLTFGSVGSQSNRLLDISGGTVNIGTLSTGMATGVGQALTHIHGGTVTLENILTFFSGSIFRLSSIDLAVPANSTYGNATIDVLSGSTLALNGTFGTGSAVRTLTKTGPGTLTVNGAQSYAATAGANINGGTINYNTNVGAGMNDADVANLAVTVSGAGTTANFNSDQKLRALTVNGGAVATVIGDALDKTLRSAAVTVNAGGKLDMADNDMIVDYVAGSSPEFALRDKVLLFRDGGETEGIAYTRTLDDDTILAFGEAVELAVSDFNGFTVDNTTVVGKYTYYGDANFDGQVTTDDYVAVDLGLGTGDSWVQGDFDLNGVVTTDDYVVVDLNLGKGTNGDALAIAEEQAAMIALHTEMFGQSYVDKLAYASEFGWVAASVPEPGALSLVGLGALGLLGRRRRAR